MKKRLNIISGVLIASGIMAHIYRLNTPEMMDANCVIVSDNLGPIVIGLILIIMGIALFIYNFFSSKKSKA